MVAIALERLARLQGSKPKITQPASAGRDTLSPSITKVSGEVLKDRKEGIIPATMAAPIERTDVRLRGRWCGDPVGPTVCWELSFMPR